MAREQEHERPEDLVESPGQEEGEARSLEDAVDSHHSLEGYFAMNNVRDGEELEAERLKQEQDRAAKKKES